MGVQMYRVRTEITGGPGGTGLSTMYFDGTGGLTAQHAADAVRAFWDYQKAHISNNLTMTTLGPVYTLDDATGAPLAVTATTTTPVVGTDGSDEESWATQGLLELRTGNFISGREIRGRIFIPTPGSGQGSGGVPTAGYLSMLNAAAAALVADPNSSWEVWSRRNAVGVAVVSANAWSKWAVLRSRRD